MTKFPCTLCGSRDWPTTDTSCELCYGEPDEDVTDLRLDRYEDDDEDVIDLRPDRYEDDDDHE